MTDSTRLYTVASIVDGRLIPLAAIEAARSTAAVSLGGRPRAMIIQPFDDAPIVSAAPDGLAVLLLLRDLESGLRLRRINADGTVAFDASLPVQSRRLTSMEIDREIDQFAESLRGVPVSQREIRRALREVLYAPSHTFGITRVRYTPT